MCAKQINPWRMAIDEWLDRVDRGDHAAAFRDKWMRLGAYGTADLELRPIDLGPTEGRWLLLALELSSLGKRIGFFSFAVRDGYTYEKRNIIIAGPKFSDNIPNDLRMATLACVFKLAPIGSQMEVILDDVVESTESTLGAAAEFTNVGWGLNPANTCLISEDPRRWVFRFSKN